MESQASRWSAPSLTRHKAAIVALTAVALGCSIYYIHDQIWPSSVASKPTTQRLHRSNARRQPRQNQRASFNSTLYSRSRYITDAWNSTPIDLAFLQNSAASDDVLAHHMLRLHDGQICRVLLSRQMPFVDDLHRELNSIEEAVTLRHELEEAFLALYFCLYLSPSTISTEQMNVIIHELSINGEFSRDSITSVLVDHQSHQLTPRIDRWREAQQRRSEEVQETGHPPLLISSASESALGDRVQGSHRTTTDEGIGQQWRGEQEMEDANSNNKEGQGLLHLLYRIAEEQARKDGYVHRRITCNACNTMPIRGIRYHCANCVDFDLCEQCEAAQIHPKTHVFYKIRIPAPPRPNIRRSEPLWYPGNPATMNRSLPREMTTPLCKHTGFQVAEVEALWEQFTCLASTEEPHNSSDFPGAIDRQTFDKCFVPQCSPRPPPPNLIHDRMFAFYDQNGDGMIDFEDFVASVAILSRKKPDELLERLFKSYDINGDGFVDRKDFLRIFRAYYALTKELTRDIVAAMGDDVPGSGVRQLVLGSKPLSSGFSHSILDGELARSGEGKVIDEYGDLRIIGDGVGPVDEEDRDLARPSNTIIDALDLPDSRHELLSSIIHVKNDPWPSDYISMADVDRALRRKIPVEQITLIEDQNRCRRVAHARFAEDYLQCSKSRRMPLIEIERRRALNLNGEDGATPSGASKINHRDTADLAQLDLVLSQNLKFLVSSREAHGFFEFLQHEIEEMNWPEQHSSATVATHIVEMIMAHWSRIGIAEDLLGYAADISESKAFVWRVFETLRSLVDSPYDKNSDQDPIGIPPSTRRSRSSSKVRFEDDVGREDWQGSHSRTTSISSRSIPLNERWGGADVLEPERDVGREVLYQVTQEAVNELLDPVFRLREDLAFAMLGTKRDREIFRAEAAASVEEPIEFKRSLEVFQKRWLSETYRNRHRVNGSYAVAEDEATDIRNFLKRRNDGVPGYLTAEKCPRCMEGNQHSCLPLGATCACGMTSNFQIPLRTLCGDKPTPTQPCPRCALENKDTIIGGAPHALLCPACGHKSNLYNVENVRLLSIISGEAYKAKGTGEDALARDATNEDGRVVQYLDGADEDWGPPTPSESEANLDEILVQFEDNDPPTSEPSIPRPLGQLLAQSGYRAAFRPRGVSPPHDPTLPQNRPNSDVSAPANHQRRHGLLRHPDGWTYHNVQDATITFNYFPDDPSQPGTWLPRPQEAPVDKQVPTPDSDTLRYFAALTLLEYEDKQRGGPGRFNFDEFETVMKGEKGMSLGFLGTWMEMASF